MYLFIYLFNNTMSNPEQEYFFAAFKFLGSKSLHFLPVVLLEYNSIQMVECPERGYDICYKNIKLHFILCLR